MNQLSRRKFIKLTSVGVVAFVFEGNRVALKKYNRMLENETFDVIIVGGSYSGLSAGMALGRALRKVLIIDSGNPCNRQTPFSHNFLTQDGKTPLEIAALARKQVEKYETIRFIKGSATKGVKTKDGFEIQIGSGEIFLAKKLIFATGIKDIMLNIPGSTDCWGITVLHCPYCHGYEVRNGKTGILGNGESGFEFSTLISNWTNDLTLFTNGKSTLTESQTEKLKSNKIKIVESEIVEFEHEHGHLQNVIFKDNTSLSIEAMYVRHPFEQHSTIPVSLGCALDENGYIKVDDSQKTSIHGVYACGDNTSRLRTVANAVATGATAGMMINKEIVTEEF